MDLMMKTPTKMFQISVQKQIQKITVRTGSREEHQEEHQGESHEQSPEPQSPEQSPEPIRRSTRTTKGKPRERYEGLASAQKQALRHLRTAMHGIGVTDARDFNLLYMTVLSQTAHIKNLESFYEDVAGEMALVIANLDEPPALDAQDPISLKEAKKLPDWPKWKRACLNEIQSLKERGVYDLVELPPGRSLITGKWVLKYKRGPNNKVLKWKARWVARGFTQRYGIDYKETFASVIRAATFRVIFALAAYFDLEIEQLDVQTAFLYSDLEEIIFVEQPHDFEEGPRDKNGKPTLVWRVKKGLYGLKQSPRQWFKKFSGALLRRGFKPLSADPNIFIKGNFITGLTVTVYVDDIKIIGKGIERVRALKADLMNEFQMSDLGPISYYLGIKVQRNRAARTITLSQQGYLERALALMNVDKGPTTSTPGVPTQHLAGSDSEATREECHQYLHAIGKFMYAMIETRPDMAFEIGHLASFAQNPGEQHWTALKHLIKYVRGTLDYSITYGGVPQSDAGLYGYTDANWAACKVTRRSTGGYVFMLNGGPISWTSRRQSLVAQSTLEAEYIALAQACREATWLRKLLGELGLFEPNQPILIRADNKGAISTSHNPEYHERTKHFDIRYHYTREEVAADRIKLEFVRSSDNVADGFTKPLSKPAHERFVDSLRLRP